MIKPSKSLSELLDEVTAGEVDEYMNEANDGKLTGILGWWHVTDNNSSLAYLPTERDALRYRLDVINRRLNPSTVQAEG